MMRLAASSKRSDSASYHYAVLLDDQCYRPRFAQKIIVEVGVLALDFWGAQFDGINWTIAQGNNLRVLDTQDPPRVPVTATRGGANTWRRY